MAKLITINPDCAFDCPFYGQEDGDRSEAGTWWPGDDTCSIAPGAGGERIKGECHGLLNAKCPLADTVVIVSAEGAKS